MRILLIAPSFFGYRNRVSRELKLMGHTVEVVDDRPSESTAFKSLAKLDYRFVDSQIDCYADMLATMVGGGLYDRVIYMGGMSFCFKPTHFERIRGQSKAKFSAYLWDSFANCQRFSDCLEFFDEVMSFEPGDCERYGLRFRPLFYSEEYGCLRSGAEVAPEYDACFIGSVHQKSKYEAVSHLCAGLEAMGMKVFRHFYMPSRSTEILRKMTLPSYRGGSFTTRTLSSAEVASVYSRSIAVIDSPQSGQYGLTMRTLEVVGARRKLITTNADVIKYNFYDPNNVFVSVDGSVPPASFFETGFQELPDGVVDGYSIRSFCEDLIYQDEKKAEFRRGIK